MASQEKISMSEQDTQIAYAEDISVDSLCTLNDINFELGLIKYFGSDNNSNNSFTSNNGNISK